jgi:hypothetical protein
MNDQERINPMTFDEIENLTDRIIRKINSLPVSERENRMNYVLEVLSRGIHIQEETKIPIQSRKNTNLAGFGVLIFLIGLPFWLVFPFIGYFLGGLGGFMVLVGLIASMLASDK